MTPEPNPPNSPPRRVSLVEQELMRSVEWLISLRWLAGAAVILGAPLAAAILMMPLPVGRLFATGAAVLGYNAGLYVIHGEE